MASVPPTQFPNLFAYSSSPSSVRPGSPATASRHCVTRDIEFDGAAISDADILHGFAVFVSTLTAQDDIAFLYQAKGEEKVASATVERGRVNYITTGLEPLSADASRGHDTSELAFALKVINTDSKDSSLQSQDDTDRNLAFSVAHLTDQTRPSLRIRYKPELIPAYHVEAIISAVAQSLSVPSSRNTDEEPNPEASVLNFPPRVQPPSLPADIPDSADEASLALLHHAFERRARQHPDRLAVDFIESTTSKKPQQTTLTYSQLDAITTQIAMDLRGLIKGDPDQTALTVIPALLSTSVELYVSWLAVLKSGFTFSPLPIDSPDEQLHGVLEDLSAKVVLGQGSKPSSGVLDKLHWLNVSEYITNTDQHVASGSKQPAIDTQENSIAYVMYTSGSTGVPKGVQISHLAATCSIASHAQLIPTNVSEEGFRWFQFAAPTFDPSVMEIFMTLSSGGTICACPRDVMLSDPETAITKLEAAIMMSTPSMARTIRPSRVPTLKSLWTMGEALSEQTIRAFGSKNEPGEGELPSLVNAYGPTEGAINCTLVSSVVTEARGSIIGSPTMTAAILVVESSETGLIRPVPLGMTGELCIAGPQVSHGYLNKPEQTAKSFVQTPQYGRIYRTGDKARVVFDQKTQHPVIEYLGRMDQEQVKLSGRRVELGSVESCIASASGVKEVAVSVYQLEQRQGSERLAAFVVPQAGVLEKSVLQSCRNSAKAGLQSFTQPAQYFLVSSLPRSAAGKIDRKALRAQAQHHTHLSARPSSPKGSFSQTSHQSRSVLRLSNSQRLQAESTSYYGSTSIEQQRTGDELARRINAAFGLAPDSILAEHDLVSMGVDSLHAIQLLQRLRDQGVQGLTISDLLRSSTLEDLAYKSHAVHSKEPQNFSGANHPAVVAFETRQREAAIKKLNISPADVDHVLPTTATQAGLLSSFIRSTSSDSETRTRNYINHSIFHLTDGIDPLQAEAAWVLALRRHSVFRTVFVQVDDDLSPFAHCELSATCQLGRLQKRTIVCEDGEDEFSNAIQKGLSTAERQITLDRPPVILSIVQAPSRCAIVLSMLHAIFDGGSFQWLLRDVAELFDHSGLKSTSPASAAINRHYSALFAAEKAQFEQATDRESETSPECKAEGVPQTSAQDPARAFSISSLSSGDDAGTETTTSSLTELSTKTGLSEYTPLAQSIESLVSGPSRSAEYWAEYLDGFTPTAFPQISTKREDTLPDAPCVAEVLTNASLSHLREQARAIGVSTLSLVQAAWAAILASYTGTQDVCFGAVTGDINPSTVSCMGPSFVTVPVRVQLDPAKDSVARVLDRLSADNSAAQDHLHVPLGSTTTIDGKLPYDTLLAMQVFAGSGDGLSEASQMWSSVDYPPMANDFAAMVEVWPLAANVKLRVTYPGKLMDKESAEMMMKQFDHVLQALASQPRVPVLSAMSSLPNNLLAFQHPKLENYQQSRLLLHGLFEDQVRRDPRKSALIFKDDLAGSETTWTYAQLNRRAEMVALALSSNFKTLRGEVVLLMMDRSPLLYATVLAVLKMGAAWCPIDTSFPAERQRLIMIKARGKALVVANEAAKSAAASVAPEGMRVFDAESLMDDGSRHTGFIKPSSRPASTDRAYVIFTSGTTGTPKGIEISHKNASNAINSLILRVPFASNGPPRHLQFSQYTFDIFVQDLFYTWGSGGVLISSPRDLMLRSFSALANATHATHANLTPSFGAITDPQSLTTLEVVTFIGEKLTQPVADAWTPGLKAFNTYGPAETAIVSTARQFGPLDYSIKSHNIGEPLDTVGAYVVDPATGHTLAPRNGAGQLAIAGDQVSSGYWQEPELTKKAFIYNKQLRRRLYLTGDMVRMLPDGTLEFLGRNDDLVKLSGIRVELGEIANQLKKADPTVRQVEVIQCPRPNGDGKVLVAFLAGPGANDTDIAAVIKEHAHKTLPEYMIPNAVIPVGDLPITASAKVDRKALRQVFETRGLGLLETEDTDMNDQMDDATWKASYSVLLNLIADIAGVPIVSLKKSTTLSALGIDSITILRSLSKFRAANLDLSLSRMLSCRNLAALCDLAGESTAVKGGQVSVSSELQAFQNRWQEHVTKAIGKATVLPITTLQEGLLSETLQQPDAYWTNHVYNLTCAADIDRLRHAWMKVARNVEALRLGFLAKSALEDELYQAQDHSPFLQFIKHQIDIDWKVQVVPQDLESAIHERFDEITQSRRQSLFREPPWAVTVFDCSHSRTSSRAMMLTIHHSIYDAASIESLENELERCYKGPAPASPPQLSQALANFSLLGDRQSTIDYWNSRFDGFSVQNATVPQVNSVSKQKLNHRTISSQMRVPHEKLKQAASNIGVQSALSIIRAAWGIILCDILETQDVLFAEIVAERFSTGVDANLIGPLVSTLPIPIQSSGSLKDVVSRDAETIQSAMQHRSIRPTDLRRILKLPASQLLYPAVFSFHAGTTVNRQKSQLWVKQSTTDISVEHPLALNVFDEGEGQRLRIELSIEDTIMDEAQHQIVLRQFEAIVDLIVNGKHVTVDKIANSLPFELQSISTPWSKIEWPAKMHPTYWIEHFANSNPDWKGVEIATHIDSKSAKSTSMTFAELDQASNRVANLIKSLGVSRQTIGLCLGRTLEAVATTVGIFKSGCTYLPIDDALPQERRKFLLEDSKAALVFADHSFFDECEVPDGCRALWLDEADYQFELSQVSDTLDAGSLVRMTDPAYLLYTSGSTGKPKGCLISYENLSSFVEAQSEFICGAVPATNELGGKGKWLGLASRAFDPHLAELFLAWRHGMSATTGPRSMVLDNLSDALTQLGITHWACVPSLLDQTGLTPEDAPSLVFLSIGGEKMSAKARKTWAGHHRVGLINAYGPTETTIGLCSRRVTATSSLQNIGSPMADSRAHILVPDTLNYVKRGSPGELCVTGSLVGLGYYNRPDAKGFMDLHGEKMYRTGDIVRLLADDTIEFIGRKDSQVKIRGQRVELGEVSEGVRTACTDDGDYDVVSLYTRHKDLPKPLLVSFVSKSSKAEQRAEAVKLVPAKETALEPENVKTQARIQLPVFMVPDIVLQISYIPLAPTSGKADNKLLDAFFSSIPISQLVPGHREEAGPSLHPQSRALTEEEMQVAKILKTVIGQEDIAIQPSTHIFELGIDSLSAINVFTRMQKAGFSCGVAEVLQAGTLQNLAKLPLRKDKVHNRAKELVTHRLQSLKHEYHNDKQPYSRSNDVEMVRPCLPLQETMVGRTFSSEDDASYINQIVLKLESSIDISRLKQAWTIMCTSNPILRTCFALLTHEIVQIVLKPGSFSLPWVEVAQSNLQDVQTHTCLDIAASISEQPPIRFTLLNASQPRQLCISIHHGLYDGLSLPAIFEDVQTLYDGKTPSPRPELQNVIENCMMTSLDTSRDYWQQLLEGWEKTELLDPERPDNLVLQTESIALRIGVEKLQEVASKLGCTLATLLLGAFGVCLAREQKVNDLIVGTVLTGRAISVPDAERIIGPCLNTLPSRILLEDRETSWKDFLVKLQDTSSRTLKYQHTSARSIQKWVSAARPLYDCLFSYNVLDGQKPSGLFSEVENDIKVDYSMALECDVNHSVDKITLNLGFSQSFEKTSAASILERMGLLLDSISSGSNPKLADFVSTSPTTSSTVEITSTELWSNVQSKLRKHIAEFAQVGEESIRQDTPFVTLSIDSISALRLSRQLRDDGLKVSSGQLIRLGSIFQVAKMLESNPVVQPSQTSQPPASALLNTASATSGITSMDIKSYPCTPLQSGMITDTIASGGNLYVHHHPVVLKPSTSIRRLKEAFTALSFQLDILRTSFHRGEASSASWMAKIHASPQYEWATDTSMNPSDEWTHAVTSYTLDKESDFARTPMKVTILVSKQQKVMVLSLSHALYDGVSLLMMMQRLQSIYLGEAVGPSRPFSSAAHEIAHSQTASVGHWTATLDGYTGVPDSGTKQSDPATPTLLRRKATTDMTGLKMKCSILEVTMEDACVLAFAKAYACFIGVRDAAFGRVVSGRTGIEDGNDVVGPTFNTVPQRVQLANILESNIGAVRKVRSSVIESLPHQHASLSEILKRWRKKNTSTTVALIDALFVYQFVDPSLVSNQNAIWTPFEGEGISIPSQYYLNFEIEEQGQTLTASVLSQADPDRLQAFMDEFAAALHDIIESSQRSVSAVPERLSRLPLQVEQASELKVHSFDDLAIVQHFENIRSAVATLANVSEDSLSPETSIFSLGITSIEAIQLAKLCRDKSSNVQLRDIIQGVLLGRICELVYQREKEEEKENIDPNDASAEDGKPKALAAQILGYDAANIEAVLPTLAGQDYHLRAWLQSGRTLYEPAWVMKSTQRLDSARLKEAWSNLCQRHQTLRMTFVATSSTKTWQVIFRPDVQGGRETFSSFDSSALNLQEAGQDLARNEARRPSSLSLPPIRLRHVRASDGDAVAFIIHHACYDAWTMPRLIEELASLYHEKSLPAILPFSEQARAILHNMSKIDAENYWESTLRNIPTTLIKPVASSRSPAANNDQRQSFAMITTQHLVKDLESKCSAFNATLPQIIMAAFSKLLARNTGVESPVFGLFEHGRLAQSGDEEIAGPCVNLLPFALRDATQPNHELIRSIQEDLSKRVPFEQSRLSKVLKWARLEKLPFNTHLNLVWPKQADQGKAKEAFFQPLPIGVPTDFALGESLPGKTMVDELDLGMFQKGNLFVDVGPDYESGRLVVGVRADVSLMSREDITGFISEFEGEIARFSEV